MTLKIIKGLKNIVLLFIGIAFTTLILYYAFNLYFLFKGYDYVEYDRERYIVVDSLYFEDAIIYDENAEYSGYKNGSEVSVNINGWHRKNMILLDDEENNYLFDYDHFNWLVKETVLDTELFDTNKIERILVKFGTTDTKYELSEEEKHSFLQYAEDLKSSDNTIPDDFTYPLEDNDIWGEFCIKGYNMPDNAYYSMFHFSNKDGQIFLLSNSNSFGFEFGKYIYIQPANK